MQRLPITVIILTHNEEQNLPSCLESVENWVDQIIVVDDNSTDRTVDVAKSHGAEVVTHEFQNYADQRNWALRNTQIQNEWVFNLDADHRVSGELKEELISAFQNKDLSSINGFLIARRAIFLGKWIRYGGHYPTYHAPLFRIGKGKCENRLYDQHFVVDGETQKLAGDIIDIIAESLEEFTDRHNQWSTFEAESQTEENERERFELEPDLFGAPRQRRRWLRRFYHELPLFVRPFLYFIYRYFFRLGFMDGKEGLIFHFLQGFWFRFLVDAKIYEKRYRNFQ